MRRKGVCCWQGWWTQFEGHADRCQEMLRRTKDKNWNQVDCSWAKPAKAAAQTIVEWFENPEGRDLQVAAGTWEVFSRKMLNDIVSQESVKFVEVMASSRMDAGAAACLTPLVVH